MARFATPLALVAALALAAPAVAQDYTCDTETPRRCTVQPGFGTLTDAITAEGNDNTVFVLQRDGVYFLNGQVVNNGYALRFEAAEGTGKPPVVQPGAQNDGTSPNPTFQIFGDFSARGIYFLNISDIGSLVPRMFDIKEAGARVEITDSIFDYTRFTFFQVQANDIDVFLQDNIVRNSIWIGNQGNGRLIDVRGVTADTISVRNSTIAFQSGGLVTTGGSNSSITQLVLDHLTVYQQGNRPLYDAGSSLYVNGQISNNILVDVALAGESTVAGDPIEGVISVAEVDNVGVEARRVVVENNNYYYTDQAEAFFDNDPNRRAPQFFSNRTTQELWDAFRASPTSTIEDPISEELAFDDAPSNPAFYTYFRELFTDGQTSDYTDFSFDEDADPDGAGPLTPAAVVQVFPLAGDFGYPTTAQSYTAGSGSCPLGDLRYFEGDANVNIETCLAASFATPNEGGPLSGPVFDVVVLGNPARDRVTLRVDLDVPADLDVRLFDVLGREVAVADRALAPTGSTPVALDVATLAPGVYVYRVQAGADAVRTGRVVVVR